MVTPYDFVDRLKRLSYTTFLHNWLCEWRSLVLSTYHNHESRQWGWHRILCRDVTNMDGFTSDEFYTVKVSLIEVYFAQTNWLCKTAFKCFGQTTWRILTITGFFTIAFYYLNCLNRGSGLRFSREVRTHWSMFHGDCALDWTDNNVVLFSRYLFADIYH